MGQARTAAAAASSAAAETATAAAKLRTNLDALIDFAVYSFLSFLLPQNKPLQMAWECVTEWDSDRSTVRACVCVLVVKAAQRGIKLIEKLTMPTSNWKMRLYANEIILYVARTQTHIRTHMHAQGDTR